MHQQFAKSLDASSNVSVVVAAYNERAAICDVVANLLRAGYNPIVVDDGSTDGTGEVASKTGAVVISHPINLGQGAALQTGITFALQMDADVIVTFDADGQHQVTDIARMIDALGESDTEFVLGSRFLGDAIGLPPMRRLVLKAAVTLTRLDTGLRITDTHNGLRAMTRYAASNIQLRQNRMAHASEIMRQIANSGLVYTEVPVSIHYSTYSLGKGQKLSQSVNIFIDFLVGKLSR